MIEKNTKKQIGEIGVDKQFNYDMGHAGLGVVVSTGYGDGCYPVYAEFNDEGRGKKVWVEFISDEDENFNDEDWSEDDKDEAE